jgi:hypothetical protein
LWFDNSDFRARRRLSQPAQPAASRKRKIPALPPYIPTQEGQFTSFLGQFSSHISANSPAYGLQASDAATIAAINATWDADYTPLTSVATTTAHAVQRKEGKRG